MRDYHATAVLLPDGRVLVAGGDYRINANTLPSGEPCDYEIYVPPYLSQGDTRPVFTGGSPTIDPFSYGSEHTYPITVPHGVTISKVVLMRPGSTTHHSDFDQRYVELDFEILATGGPQVKFTAPVQPSVANRGKKTAPAGWYMLFLLSSQGVPSVAGWVKLQ